MKKLIIKICLILTFTCSCCDNKYFSDSDYFENPNQKREDEVRRIMRDDYIRRIEKSDYITDDERKELQKMKNNFYYKTNDPYNPTYRIPGPDWKVRGPLDFSLYFEWFKETLENEGNVIYRGHVGNFFDIRKDGDEIFYYRSNKHSWNNLMGLSGFILIRDNKIIYNIIGPIS